MKAKLVFIAGLAVGYVAGTRVGRRGYEDLKKNARAFWEMDPVQEAVQNLEGSIKDEAKDLGSRLVSKVAREGHGAHGTPGHNESSGKKTGGNEPARAEATDGGKEALPDVDSDPALNTELGQDWADEGGALPPGPTT